MVREALRFMGWYYYPEHDSVDAVFKELKKPYGWTTGYFAYTHIGQHGAQSWPIPDPTAKRVTRASAKIFDPSTVDEVDRLYGNVPGVLVDSLGPDDERFIDLGPQLPGVRHPTRFRRRPDVRVRQHTRRA